MAPPAPQSAPLTVVVDLDGTLTPVDTLHELVALCALRHPGRFLRALRHLPSHRAEFKGELASALPDYPRSVPWNKAVLDHLTHHATDPVLCTAGPEEMAKRTAAPLARFAAIHGTTGSRNLRGSEKARFLVEKFGERGFVYYGNDQTDLKVWAHAAKAVVVSRDPALVDEVRKVCDTVEVIQPEPRRRGLALLQILRPHQWVKNLLVFAPLLASHRIREPDLWKQSAVAFAMACLLSSGVYVFNDLHDLFVDRVHPSKWRRPFASGRLSALLALPLGAALLIGGLLIGLVHSPGLAGIGGLYLTLAFLYTFVIKRLFILDVAALAGLFTLRIFTGAAATGITPSRWLLSFSLCIFLSLALCKRYVELSRLKDTGQERMLGRAYALHHARAVFRTGLFLMIGAGAVLGLYLRRPAVTELYRQPNVLWVAAVAVSVWGLHIWTRALRQRLDDDPVLFAVRDPISWLCFASVVATYFVAS